MKISVVLIFVLELLILYIIALVFYYLMLLNRKIKLNDRFDRYTIHVVKKESRFFDDFFSFYDKFIHFVSKFLSKLKIFDNYSNKYLKYIKKEEKDKVFKMDFVSKKILLALFYILVVCFYDIIKNENITLIQILFSSLIGFYTIDIFLISANKFLQKERENDLLKAITIMNNSFKSGRSIMQAIQIVADELDSPLGLEFKKMNVDLSYGLSLEVVFERFEKRAKIEDAKYITTSLTILNETGGDIVKVFESVEKTFFNNKKLKEELKNLTASSKMLYYVLLFIPVVFVLIIYLLDTSYFNPFFTSSFGYIVLFIAILLYAIYILIIKRIMKIGGLYEI